MVARRLTAISALSSTASYNTIESAIVVTSRSQTSELLVLPPVAVAPLWYCKAWDEVTSNPREIRSYVASHRYFIYYDSSRNKSANFTSGHSPLSKYINPVVFRGQITEFPTISPIVNMKSYPVRWRRAGIGTSNPVVIRSQTTEIWISNYLVIFQDFWRK